jgi:hypothetical protein
MTTTAPRAAMLRRSRPDLRGLGLALLASIAVWIALIVFVLALIAREAHAGGVLSPTIGTSASTPLAAATVAPRRLLLLSNPAASGGANVFCELSGTPVVNGAGTVEVAPGQTVAIAAANVVFWDSVSCIATAASAPFTIIWE